MGNDPIGNGSLLFVGGAIALGAGVLFLFTNLEFALAAIIVGSLFSIVWAIAVVVLLWNILQRLPAPQEKEIKAPATTAVPPPSRSHPELGLYEINRDDGGRIIADD